MEYANFDARNSYIASLIMLTRYQNVPSLVGIPQLQVARYIREVSAFVTFLFTFFLAMSTGRTVQPIFIFDGSNDAV
jgi:hypothetical protein